MSDAEEEKDEETQEPVAQEVEEEEPEEVEDESQNDEKELIIFNKIFMGAFDDTIPPTKRKLVRIFTSSTFTGNHSLC